MMYQVPIALSLSKPFDKLRAIGSNFIVPDNSYAVQIDYFERMLFDDHCYINASSKLFRSISRYRAARVQVPSGAIAGQVACKIVNELI